MLAPVLIGDYAQATTLPAEALRPMAEVEAPPGLDVLPHRGVFVGRDEELDLLDAALSAPGEVVVQAVHGLGGIGKSALAAHWAATRARPLYRPIRWINADSAASVQKGLVDFATALQPALAQVINSHEELATRAMQWLATHTGWLLILDNVNDRNDINDLLSHAPEGRFLITSRLSAVWPDATTVLRLDVLDEQLSTILLTRLATTTGPRNMDGAAELCSELGHLALAITQVAAYLAQNPLLTPRDYLTRLAKAPATAFETGGAGVTKSERTIARIWRLTLDRIHKQQPLANDVLRILAWYGPDHIPATLLEDYAEQTVLEDALGLLTAYSMVTADPVTRTLSVHRLVQALARTPDVAVPGKPSHVPDPHRARALIERAREQATDLLRTALPSTTKDPASWPDWRTLLPHVEALADHASPRTDTYPSTWDVLDSAGQFLHEQGSPRRAIACLERALAVAERMLGEDHEVTMFSRNSLAGAYQTVSDLRRAIPLFERTLGDHVRALGEDHPDTLTVRGNLAVAYVKAGDPGRAIPLLERTLDDRVRVLGEDHPNTLMSRNDLAGAYLSAGNLGRAIPLFERTLDDRVRVLGEDHPDTLTSRNNLAGTYAKTDDPARAIPLFERTWEDLVRVLGEDHPHTLTSRSNLAGTYLSAGDPERAATLYEQTLEGLVRVLGEDHPHTLISRSNLAGTYVLAGDPERAVPLYEQTLEGLVRVLGEDHPDTLTSRNNVARIYARVGDLGRAIPLFERTLDDRMRVLGEDHPHTLVCRNDLADAYKSAGDLARAIPLFERTLDDRMRVLGEDHPRTLTARLNLASACVSAGHLGRAIPLFEQALEVAVRVLGPDHLLTKRVRLHLASALQARRH
ncbi:tetratricopeptide repeat protein [Streptomyces europaeiscabiei]|uniref:tetratricopeptide repeat protein n=1 Tax=Streptomyces europaeiscabiei TaxID=146819 RepID=UPI0038F71789